MGTAGRIGIGFDVHRFRRGRDLVLGGVTVPHDEGLEGHSDADVLTHALIDAILGAAAAGDIGDHFPDTDERYKDATSLDLLSKALAIVEGRGYRVANADTVVILDEPRLGQRKQEMREVLAGALELDVESVSVKATTAERLLTVSGRGVAATAVAQLDAVTGAK